MANSAIEFSIADFPGYPEFVEKENEIRRTACLGLNELICGIEVKPLTAANLGLLNLIRSPFLGFPSASQDILQDIGRFLWIVSPHYAQGSVGSPYLRKRLFESPQGFQRRLAAAETPRDRFNREFAKLASAPVDKLIKEILDYVEDSFIDAEDSTGETDKSFFAQDVAIAYELSKHHGYRLDFWNAACPVDKNPIHVPLKLVFQLRKVRKWNEGLVPTNKSDKLIEAGLGEMTNRN